MKKWIKERKLLQILRDRETWIERMEKGQKKEGKKEERKEIGHLSYYLQIKKKQS